MWLKQLAQWGRDYILQLEERRRSYIINNNKLEKEIFDAIAKDIAEEKAKKLSEKNDTDPK